MTVDPSSLVSLMPYAERLGIRLEQAGPELAVGTLDWAEDLCTAGGRMHGGVLMSLADSVGAACAYLNMPAGSTTSTIESKTNFFRGVGSGRVVARSTPVHVGRTTVVVQTEVRDDRDKLVALVTQTQTVATA